MNNIGVIIQARMTSTRLPGKVLKLIKDDLTMLECVIQRIRLTTLVDTIVVATTTNHTDDPIVALCTKLKVDVYRGSENDVLSRYYEAALKYGINTVIRITSDCPAIDPQVIDKMCIYYMSNYFDYVSNVVSRTFPRGLDVEIFSFNCLERAYRNATQECEREHVTAYIYGNPTKFQIGAYSENEDKEYNKYRITVDTVEDLILAQKIFANLSFNFNLNDLINLLEQHPEWHSNDEHTLVKFESSQHYKNNLNV